MATGFPGISGAVGQVKPLGREATKKPSSQTVNEAPANQTAERSLEPFQPATRKSILRYPHPPSALARKTEVVQEAMQKLLGQKTQPEPNIPGVLPKAAKNVRFSDQVSTLEFDDDIDLKTAKKHRQAEATALLARAQEIPDGKP